MKITDGKKTVDVRMHVWQDSGYGPDWSHDFFAAGSLQQDGDQGAYIVDDVDYCISQANDWAKKCGDYADVPEWEADEDRAVFVD